LEGLLFCTWRFGFFLFNQFRHLRIRPHWLNHQDIPGIDVHEPKTVQFLAPFDKDIGHLFRLGIHPALDVEHVRKQREICPRTFNLPDEGLAITKKDRLMLIN
jgi:hypothetical protein